MKMHLYILTIAIGLMITGSPSVADPEHTIPVYEGSQAFQKMKQLSGNWEGMVDIGKGPQKITANYRVTSAGSAFGGNHFCRYSQRDGYDLS